jgi:Flp pilus assembly protein TadD
MSAPLPATFPTERPALLRAALACLDAEAFGDAEALGRHLLAANAADAEALLVTALALAAAGHAARAAPLLARIAAARPDMAHPCRDAAAMLRRRGRDAAIPALFRAVLALTPGDAGLRYAFADHLHEAGAPAAAGDVLAPLAQDSPGHAAVHNLLGICLHDSGALAGAVRQFRRAIAAAPEAAEAWANLGMALKTAGRFAWAQRAYDRALALAPGDPQIRLNRAIALLRAGRLAEAWPDYECRLHVQGGQSVPFAAPLLSTGAAVAGRTILVWHEEGFGDTLQFARYLPLLARRGARVLVRAPRELARLLAAQPGFGIVLDPAAAIPAHDAHCPFFSLPRAFATTLETIPADIPYLGAPPDLAARWAGRLPRDGRRRIGLVWAGQARPWLPGFAALDRRRSMDFATLAPLAALPGLAYVSLQKGPAAQQPPPAGLVLHDPMPDATDFADTAAIIAGLDAVISVDTAVAHLAGAMGKPVLLLDRHDSCWRWLAGRADSPWYPTLRIFRQRRLEGWAGPVARLVECLAAF